MIRVIVERQLKHGEDIGHLLIDLSMIAVLKRGHVSNEMLINPKNNRVIAVLSTWRRLEDWRAWESSKERAKIIKKIDPLLVKKAQVKIYEIMSPEDCEFFEDPSGWMQEHERPHFEG